MSPNLNRLFYGDNLLLLQDKSQFPDESVDLIYLDPPFGCFADRQFGLEDWDKTEYVNNLIDSTFSYLFNQHLYLYRYLSFMAPRLVELHRVLKSTGSLYLHCDPTASHYLKILLDQIFGRKNFRNEIVWIYRTGGDRKKWFGKKHDIVLFYTKSKNYKFNPLEIKEYYDKKPGFPDRNGGVDNKGYFRYTFQPDVFDIKTVFNMSKEYLGYPTQKPVTLLEKIITASSNDGDVILDPFCGCGTALAAAQKLGRKWIGIDINETAISATKKRLN